MTSAFIDFKAILTSLFFVIVLTWPSIYLAKRLNLIDNPGSEPHKQHLRPTPLAGGIALMSALVLSEWVLGNFIDRTVRATFIAGTIIFLFGLWDDYKNIPPLVKLCGQILAALVLISLGVYVRIFESPEFFLRWDGPTWNHVYIYLDWLLTIFWLVGITNAFNFVDSMDGLAVGLGGMAAAFFMLVTLDANQKLLSMHSAQILGVCIGIYLFNSPPAMLFIGDSGAQTLGFILAALGIAYNPQGANQSSSWFVPILLLGVPILDATLVVFSRFRRGKPIYSANRDHTYHRLLGLGLIPARAVLVMQIAALALGCLASIMLSQPPLIANIVFAAVLLVCAIIVLLLDRQPIQK